MSMSSGSQQQEQEDPLFEPLIQESNLTDDSCHRSFVVEKDELFALLALLFNTYPNAEKNFEPLPDFLAQRKVTRVIVIIGFYQEQSYLLDPHLEKMVVPLINYIENEIRALLPSSSSPSSSSSSSPIHPKPTTLTIHNLLRHAFQILYTIVKVRGSKTVTRFFPHEVSDLFPVFTFLQLQDKTNYELWEVRYISILWLGCIIITPFHFATMDHLFNSQPIQSFDEIKATNQGLINNLLGICVDCLHESGKARDASAELLSRLLTRPDMSHHLNIFFEWAKQKISPQNLNKSLHSEAALMTGVLNTLASILKRGKRQELLNKIPDVFVLVSNLYREIQEGSNSGNSIVIRELLVKVIQRIGLVYLKPRVAAWRYQRGNRSLMLNAANSTSVPSHKAKQQRIEEVVDENFDDVPECMEEIIDMSISALNDKDTVVRWSAAKGIGRISGRLPQSMALDVISAVEDLLSPSNNPSDSVWHGACLAIAEFARRGLLLPEKLSTIISFVKQALVYDVAVGSHSIGSHIRDAACYVSWAFARAYSPDVLKPYVNILAPMLIIVGLLDREVNCRRAASAAFQESAGRQGNFPHGIEIITTADYFSLGNRNESYLVVAPKVAQFEEYRRPIIDHLVNIKISHWDRALRVLASQTLGVLTPIDPHYMLENVLPSIISWTTSPDLNLRHGALLSVGEIILGLSNYFQTSNQAVPYSSSLIQSVKNIIPSIESAKLNKGHGGELVRGALCRMVQCLSLAHFPSSNESNENGEDIDETKTPKDTTNSSISSLNIPISSSGPLPSAKQIARRQALLGNAPKVEKSKDFVQLLQDTLDDNLKLSKFEIQEAAMIALKEFALEYYVRVQSSSSSATLIKRYAKLIRTDPAPATRRGCCRAIGVLPKSILKPHIEESIDVLCKASQEQSPEFKDAEMRLLAAQALHKVFLTMMTTNDGEKIEHENTLSLDLIHLIFKTFQKGTEDYSSDNRGDVGSWVRETSILALQSIVKILSSSPHLLSLKSESPSSSDILSLESIVRSTVCLYLKQATERMDKIRFVAGSCIESLLKSNTPYVPHRKELEEHLLPKDVSINWGSPADTYHRVIPLIENDTFRHPIILGLVTSVGDISKLLADESRTCLVSYLFSARKEGSPVYSQFWTTFIKILEEEQRNERVIVPAFKTLVLLFGGEGMSRDAYENPLFPLDHEVFAKIFSLVTAEIKNSNDIVKIIAAVPVLCGILSSPTSTQKQSLKHLLTLLVHKYPKVRRLCADSLYTKLLTDERVWNLIRSSSNLTSTFREENFEVILELLSTVNWDGDLDVAKRERMNLYPLFGLPQPVIVQKQAQQQQQQQPTAIDVIAVSDPMITIIENKPNSQNASSQKQSVTPPQPVVDDPDEL